MNAISLLFILYIGGDTEEREKKKKSINDNESILENNRKPSSGTFITKHRTQYTLLLLIMLCELLYELCFIFVVAAYPSLTS